MENETNAVVTEETIPAEQIAQTVEDEVNDTETVDDKPVENIEGEVQEKATQEDVNIDEPIITVRFNHTDRPLTKSEAVTLAQKGLKLDAMSDMLNDISYLAAIQNTKPAELIKGYIGAMENIKRREFEIRYGEDKEVVEVMMEKFKTENEKKFSSFKQTLKQREEAVERNINLRLADEFRKMKADFSELTDYISLPTEVKRAAVNGMPLRYAYLEHKYAQEKFISAAKAQAEATSRKSTGSMATAEMENLTENALLRGVWD